MQGRRTTLVPPDGISPVCEERPNGGGATCSDGAMQGRHTTLVFRIRICASLNQELNDGVLSIGVPGSRPRNPVASVVERLGAPPGFGRDRFPLRDQLLVAFSLVG